MRRWGHVAALHGAQSTTCGDRCSLCTPAHFTCMEDVLLGRAGRVPRMSLGRASAPLGVDARSALFERVGPFSSGLRHGFRCSPPLTAFVLVFYRTPDQPANARTLLTRSQIASARITGTRIASILIINVRINSVRTASIQTTNTNTNHSQSAKILTGRSDCQHVPANISTRIIIT